MHKGMGGPHGMMHRDPCADMAARGEAHLAFMRSKLAITPAQETAYNTFATAFRSAQQPVAAVCASKPATPPTSFPDKFDLHLKMAQAHVQEMAAMAAPTRALYNALTPAQQKTLDEMHGRGPK
jgi:hypothetical protein